MIHRSCWYGSGDAIGSLDSGGSLALLVIILAI